MTAPERIWIDAWGGNWSPQAGGTQGVEYIRADLAAVQPAQVQPDPRDDVISKLVNALERIGGVRGPYGFPFPEADLDYGAFAVVEARVALASAKAMMK